MPRSGSRQKQPFRRSQRRSDAHDAAHAQDAPEARSLPDHPLILKQDPEFISTADALNDLVRHLRDSDRFAYDTEFISEESYNPRICLIQICTAERLALIDPLASIELTPLWEVIADPRIETIVHAGAQDLEPVVRATGAPPANTFDTQVAAGFIGLPYPLGLTRLTETLLDIQLHKDFTFARWDKRPLSRRLQRYAADDVRFLPALRHAIGARLAELGHEDHARRECATLEEIGQYQFDADAVLPRVNGARPLERRQLAILRELVTLRDEVAQTVDLPPRTVLRDDVLIRLTKDAPKELDALESIRGLPRPFQRDYGQAILDAVARGRACDANRSPHRLQQHESPPERFAIDGLYAAASAWCHGNSIDPSLAFTRGDIADWYRAQRSGGEHCNGRLTRGWRKTLVTDRLLALMNGTGSLHFRWEDDRLSAPEPSL